MEIITHILMVVSFNSIIFYKLCISKAIDPIIPVEDEELGYPTTHWSTMDQIIVQNIRWLYIGDVYITAELKKMNYQIMILQSNI